MGTRLTRKKVEEIIRSAREKGQKPNFCRANLRGVDLHRTDLREANFSGADLIEADLSAADLSKADLREADLSWTKLNEAILFKADLSHANLYKADLTQAILNDAVMIRADLYEAILFEAQLIGTNLSEAYLMRTILINASLSLANLSQAYLQETDLHKADLYKANLSKADIYLANFTGANLSKIDLSEAVVGRGIFGDVDLSTVKGLETVRHNGPSTIGIDTIFCSKGNIPPIFLERTGVLPEFIAYLEKIKIPKCQYSQETLDIWIITKQQVVETCSRRLGHYQRQAAEYGSLNVPFHIIEEIDKAKKEIEEGLAQIKEWQQLKDLHY
ncbi:MAG: hypothetical protein BroJett011_48820 [Chloroflexota bacterium]|nr:MAG: hypothetical protein BroJett011_48820 [Chloroflexota bacterium]